MAGVYAKYSSVVGRRKTVDDSLVRVDDDGSSFFVCFRVGDDVTSYFDNDVGREILFTRMHTRPVQTCIVRDAPTRRRL